MPVIGWVDTEADVELIELVWPDAMGLEPAGVEHFLRVAHEQCWEFLNHKTDPDPVPARYLQAQIMQARAQHRSGVVGEGNQVGPDGLTVTVYPMDRSVKALLRPRRGRPVVM